MHRSGMRDYLYCNKKLENKEWYGVRVYGKKIFTISRKVVRTVEAEEIRNQEFRSESYFNDLACIFFVIVVGMIVILIYLSSGR